MLSHTFTSIFVIIVPTPIRLTYIASTPQSWNYFDTCRYFAQYHQIRRQKINHRKWTQIGYIWLIQRIFHSNLVLMKTKHFRFVLLIKIVYFIKTWTTEVPSPGENNKALIIFDVRKIIEIKLLLLRYFTAISKIFICYY